MPSQSVVVLFEIERASPCRASPERYLVEMPAKTAADARFHVAYSLDEHERIVCPVLRAA